MRRDDRFDTGCLVPRFQDDGHRLKLAFLVVIEGEDLKDLPRLAGYPARVYLLDAADALEISDAQGFVNSFRKEEICRSMLRRIFGKEKGCNLGGDTSSLVEKV